MKTSTIQAILCLCMLLWGVQRGNTQSLDEVIAKHLDAIGGADTWRKIKSMKVTAQQTGYSRLDPEDAGIRTVTTTLHGVGSRLDMYLDTQVEGKDSTAVKRLMSNMVSPYTGGWMVQGPDQEAQAMPEEMYRYTLLNIDLHPLLLDHAQKKRSFRLKKRKKKIGGESCYVIEGQLTAGVILDLSLYISTESYYLVRRSEGAKDPSTNTEAYIETTFADFREVDGYVLPFKETKERFYGGQVFSTEEAQVEEIQVNAPVDEAIFEPDEDS